MFLSELNLRSLGVNATSVLPVNVALCIEGNELSFNITAFQSGHGSGKKSVVSGSIKRTDNGTTILLENSDIESVRRKVCKLLLLSTTCARKPRTPKVDTEVKKISETLKVVRRLCLSNTWVSIDTDQLRNAFKEAHDTDRENARKALQARAVNPLLAKIEKLSPEERALLLASLQ